MEITELLKEAVSDLKDSLDIDAVIGKPIVSDEITVIPISKMSVGFVSGGAEVEGKSTLKRKEYPAGGVGGGANIVPIGFLTVNGSTVKFLKTDGGEKWNNCVDAVLDFLTSK